MSANLEIHALLIGGRDLFFSPILLFFFDLISAVIFAHLIDSANSNYPQRAQAQKKSTLALMP
jgi:hypothetical protein